MITRDLKLGEYTYKVDEFSATKRMILQFKIAKVFSSFYKNVSSAKSEQDLQKKIFEVFEQADPEESAKIIKELIMETFNLNPCREIGVLKEAIKEAILEGEIANDYEEAYDFMLKKGKQLTFGGIAPMKWEIECVCQGCCQRVIFLVQPCRINRC